MFVNEEIVGSTLGLPARSRPAVVTNKREKSANQVFESSSTILMVAPCAMITLSWVMIVL